MQGFINELYTYDFTGNSPNDGSSDQSDIEIDLELSEKEDDKEEVEASAPVVDDEVTSKILRQNTACTVIDNY